MVIEDVYSQAMLNMEREIGHSRTISAQSATIEQKNLIIEQRDLEICLKNQEIEQEMIRNEDYCVIILDL